MLVEGGLQETIPAHELDLSVHRIEIDVDRRPAAALLDRQAIQPAEVHEEIRLSYQRVHASCSWAILDAMFRVDENPALAEPQPVEETGSCGDTVVIGRAKIVGDGVERWRVVSCILVEPDIIPKRAQPEEVVRCLPSVTAKWETHQIARQNNQTSSSHHLENSKPSSTYASLLIWPLDRHGYPGTVGRRMLYVPRHSQYGPVRSPGVHHTPQVC